MDCRLAYIDQASFLSFRALGRGPLMQYTWIYDRPVDLAGIRRFQRNLADGMLGRRIERSPLPFGRHRWVASSGPADIAVSVTECARAEVGRWADERIRLPIDPEHGPAWHLGVQPFTDGGAAVSLVASHSVVDGQGMTIAIVDAVNGFNRELGYSEPGSRLRRQALAQDIRAAVRSVPELGKAAVSAVRVARAEREDLATSFKTAGEEPPTGDDIPVLAPTVAVFIDLDQWDDRARQLGGTSNSLFAGLATRLGRMLGRGGDDGLVTLSWPVSDRTEGDTRANALIAAKMRADPDIVITDLNPVRSAMKSALAESGELSARLLAPLPLTPFTPQALVRRLEAMVVSVDNPIGCSNIGELDPAMNRPDGTDADLVSLRLLEPQITTRVLNRIGGYLSLVSGRVHGRIFISVGAWTVGAANTKEALREVVGRGLADFGLSGIVE
ncbi:diacylglycerol O-acyltransferase [Mycobacterium frederiksbergense]|uniref:Diacylglycerol O-acyltransferase n=1 Tax=Mycolicibacterium frederiksbergense TaxID=117567 RepID=A0ABT6KSW6_9MYCO|nr:hypothetical protein [Mycolicibacterium frederiksbergense]MDH6193824.1 diacylglycerol O-acyltransferase [Mycolicibacterium frederiksbergense]